MFSLRYKMHLIFSCQLEKMQEECFDFRSLQNAFGREKMSQVNGVMPLFNRGNSCSNKLEHGGLPLQQQKAVDQMVYTSCSVLLPATKLQ